MRQDRHHLVARLEIPDVCADRSDHARAFQSRRKGKRRLGLVSAVNHDAVGKVHRRRSDIQQHLVRAGNRRGDIGQLQAFNRSEFTANQGAHGFQLFHNTGQVSRFYTSPAKLKAARRRAQGGRGSAGASGALLDRALLNRNQLWQVDGFVHFVLQIPPFFGRARGHGKAVSGKFGIHVAPGLVGREQTGAWIG